MKYLLTNCICLPFLLSGCCLDSQSGSCSSSIVAAAKVVENVNVAQTINQEAPHEHPTEPETSEEIGQYKPIALGKDFDYVDINIRVKR